MLETYRSPLCIAAIFRPSNSFAHLVGMGIKAGLGYTP